MILGCGKNAPRRRWILSFLPSALHRASFYQPPKDRPPTIDYRFPLGISASRSPRFLLREMSLIISAEPVVRVPLKSQI
jgi:hypothetical protein